MMAYEQPCNTCPKCIFEPADPDLAPSDYGHYICFYTDRNVDKWHAEHTFAPSCPLIVNERPKFQNMVITRKILLDAIRASTEKIQLVDTPLEYINPTKLFNFIAEYQLPK